MLRFCYGCMAIKKNCSTKIKYLKLSKLHNYDYFSNYRHKMEKKILEKILEKNSPKNSDIFLATVVLIIKKKEL